MAALAPAAPAAQVPWLWRVREALAAYLPLLLMALLALGTWWLVKNTPSPEGTTAVPAPRHEPDYTMRQFLVQRFAPDGRLKVQLEGDELRHYPDTDTIEVDQVHVRAFAPDGRVTTATARHALSNADASEVQLMGGARVVREARTDSPAIEFRGEFLHAFLDTEQVRSHLPVTLRQEGSELRGDTLFYDNLTRTARLVGHVSATFPGAATRPAR
ncbi:MAG TPA: LPS export ABC transporter periplasmic protein LptC [Ideonella sp.]|nr:LPS export ABC transporter periplasmic protein LptC [Ideonella sp.]